MKGGHPVVYLGISGVLHPSKSVYELLRGRSPWTDGHTEYEGVPVLEHALLDWPGVRIVLTSTQPRSKGLPSVLERLGPTLAARVEGYTYEDLTTKVKREVWARQGAKRSVGFSDHDYWRLNKAQIVEAHVQWFSTSNWIAIDDEDILWSPTVRQDKLVLTDGCIGLLCKEAQARLNVVLRSNFGQLTPCQGR